MRIPLHIKLMVSYLLVVGLVFLPTFVYLRHFQRQDLERRLAGQLIQEARAIGDRLASAPPERFNEALQELVAVVPQRLTVVDARGELLADSYAHGSVVGRPAEEPEVVQAFANESGFATSLRRSATLRELTLYAAVRFPVNGAPRGAVRLEVPASELAATSESGSTFVNGAGAVALSAAVLLSLLAALVVSRPLRRITDGARAFAAGDFGHPIEIDSDDELGDAAKALTELASQLRGRLLSSGADRAALHALLDDLPVGVVLFDSHGQPIVISARAREMCELLPHQELERAQQLLESPVHAALIQQVLADGFTREAPLELPWKAHAGLTARWIALFGPEGDRQPALVVLDDRSLRARSGKLEKLVSRAAEKARAAGRDLGNRALASDLSLFAEELEAELEVQIPAAAEVRAVGVGELCQVATDEVLPLATTSGVQLELALDEPAVKVVEAGNRSREALRSLLLQAVRQSPRGHTVVLRGELAPRSVRLSVRAPQIPANLARMGQLVQSLGGDAGSVRDGEATVAWVELPRA